MSDCVFCEIVAGRVPASIVFRDERCCAFMDIQPVNPGHVLIVPVEHVVSIDDLDEGIGGHLFTVAQRISRRFGAPGATARSQPLPRRWRGGRQEVFHVHLHLFPRFRNDGFGLRLGPDYGILPTRSDLDEVAEAIRAGL